MPSTRWLAQAMAMTTTRSLRKMVDRGSASWQGSLWPLVLRAVCRHRDPDEEAGLADVEVGVAHQLHRQSARFVVLVESVAHHVSLAEHRVAITVVDHDVALRQGRDYRIIGSVGRRRRRAEHRDGGQRHRPAGGTSDFHAVTLVEIRAPRAANGRRLARFPTTGPGPPTPRRPVAGPGRLPTGVPCGACSAPTAPP